MKKPVFLFVLCTAAMAMIMVTCSKKSNPTGPGDGSNTMTMTYTMLGSNKIITSQPQSITSYTYCNGNTLATGYDTSDASIDTMGFVISANNDSLIVGSADSAMVFTRVGTGNGIQGQWTGSVGSIVIGPNTITVTETASSSGDAEMFVEDWNSYPEANNVTVAQTSPTSVTLTGNSTHEVVTITFSSTGETFTSSIAAHTASTYYYNPTSCPDPDYPTWYEQFLADNTTLAKKAASVQSALHHGLISLLIKKTVHHN